MIVTSGARYVFTVTAGRSGQASLCDLLRAHVPGCYAAFEEPSVEPVLPGLLGDLERRFRRRFVETHELLGRGHVLTAFEQGDETYLDGIVRKRLRMAGNRLAAHGASIYIDVSKYFARGLHRAFARAVPDPALIRLVRDPVCNMRSFLNRDKNFTLDNSLPDAGSNCLRLNSSGMEKGELYLWAWCEMYLRFDRLVEEFKIERAVEIRTEHLTDPKRMDVALDALDLPHRPVTAMAPRNTNAELGYGMTSVTADDVVLFERFLNRIPADIRRRMTYFDTYDPSASLASARAGKAMAEAGNAR
jgi:hypothetical protein